MSLFTPTTKAESSRLTHTAFSGKSTGKRKGMGSGN